jgi:hypothetical protein
VFECVSELKKVIFNRGKSDSNGKSVIFLGVFCGKKTFCAISTGKEKKELQQTRKKNIWFKKYEK